MSREFLFYPGIKDSNNKYNCLYWKKDNDNYVPADIYWATGSFIDGNWFLENARKLQPVELHQDIADTFTWSFDKDTPFEKRECYLYEIPISLLESTKPEKGLIEGYIPIEEAEIFGRCEDMYEKQEFVAWNMTTPISANVYADFPPSKRDEYSKISFVDTYSAGYVCNLLSEALKSVDEYKLNKNKEEPCILMLYSF